MRHGGNFRTDSTPTLGGYSSGAHEVVTTDTYNFLRRAVDLGNGKHKLPTTGGSGFWATRRGEKVYSATLKVILDHADGFRTDTAQTVLSAPGGLAAGHSGAGLDTTGQKGAHDLLRQSIYNLLVTDPATKGMSAMAILNTLGAITVTSMAPAELALKLPGGTAALKAADTAKSAWEANRTSVKRRVEHVSSFLSANERDFVHAGASAFLEGTQSGQAKKPRHIPKDRATSPERDPAPTLKGHLAGGPYLATTASPHPDISFPQKVAAAGLYFTQPFRSDRL